MSSLFTAVVIGLGFAASVCAPSAFTPEATRSAFTPTKSGSKKAAKVTTTAGSKVTTPKRFSSRTSRTSSTYQPHGVHVIRGCSPTGDTVRGLGKNGTLWVGELKKGTYVYNGFIENNKPHGYGVLTIYDSEGKVIEELKGEFVNNTFLRNGRTFKLPFSYPPLQPAQ